MRKRERKNSGAEVKLDMTPMIDVVFQLLAFFTVTFTIPDVLSRLDVTRPAPDPNARPEQSVDDLLTITVWRQGYVLRSKEVDLAELERQLTRLGSISKNITVIIRCSSDSPHMYLVQLLDLCAKAGLTKLSVFSIGSSAL